jgi:hypothetical protein
LDFSVLPGKDNFFSFSASGDVIPIGIYKNWHGVFIWILCGE